MDMKEIVNFWNIERRCLFCIFVLILIWLGFCAVLHINVDHIYKSSIDISSIQFESIQQELNHNHNTINTDTKILLYWTPSFAGPDWFGYGLNPFKNCTFSNCFATRDTRYFDIADGLLFNARFVLRFPIRRTTNQRWILLSSEAPANERRNYVEFNGKFNATSSYHRKSDIHWPYRGYNIEKLKTANQYLLQKNYAAGKTKLLAWYVSHCYTRGKRENYLWALQKYIPVDIYGKCGDKLISRGKTGHSYLEENYKFYFAAENCICEDYASEKLADYFPLDVVLVVYGGFNYSDFLPPGTFINAMDYPNAKDLAEYLFNLDKDDELYNRYLQRKAAYQFVPMEPVQCAMCSYLHRSQNTTKTYERMDLFWNKYTQCSNPPPIIST